MPIYEYQCTQCNERTEVIQNFSDPPQSECARCGGEVKKLFSSPAIQFKGSGFYKTDYASPSSAAPSSVKGEKSESSKSESSKGESSPAPSTSSDSKSESKAKAD
ncbi:MAG TPA: FmdB family zinc ribbon protein [Thermoanaerobaculia bacterium]|jgi:putative FmdB family regulatory protein